MEQRIRRKEGPGGRRPRDAAHWARYVESLHVPDAGGVSTLNVEGRRTVGPLQGFGKMWQKTYRVCLEGAAPAQVVETWREGFARFAPFGKSFRAPSGGLVPGAVALLGGISGVMVLFADDECFTYMTPEGHPFSGWISFSAYPDEGATVAQAQLLIRANDPLYELMTPLGLSAGEDMTWKRTLRNLAASFGVRDAKVETRIVCVDPRRQWRRYGNIRHNALLRCAFHALTAPIRFISRFAKTKS
jgi:hypothetical protein